MSPRRIQVNVVGNRSEILALVDRQRLVPSLKQMPPNLVPRIEPLRIGALKPLHSIYQIRFGSLKKQMIVVTHQDKRMDQPPVPFRHLPECIQKPLIIFCILKDSFLMIPPTHHMIGRARKFSSWFSCHKILSNKKMVRVNYNDDLGGLTPFF